MNETPFYQKPSLNFALPDIKSKGISTPANTKASSGGGANWGQGQIDLQLSNVAAAKQQIATTSPPVTRLQERIDKATAQGKDDKVARLQGKQDRKDVRQKSRAKRETQRNVEREEVTQERQDRKTQRFESRRAGVDGVYGTADDTTPVSSVGMFFDKIGGLFRKDNSPVPMKMSAKQYAQSQRNSKIAKDI